MALASKSLAVTSVPGTSFAILTALEPVAVMASATFIPGLPRALRSMTLTSLLNAICSLKNTEPALIFPGPRVECISGTRIFVAPSVITFPGGVKCFHRS